MRHMIDWWAFVTAREDDWSRQIYDHARARGQGKYRALRGVGARWTRILWRCWTDHATYNPDIHHKTNKLDLAFRECCETWAVSC